jgi:hypothetical protein
MGVIYIVIKRCLRQSTYVIFFLFKMKMLIRFGNFNTLKLLTEKSELNLRRNQDLLKFERL